jgi:putative ABC transport system substrate-binding protein
MRRREFLGVLGGAAAAWPVVARAQQVDRMRRIGILMNSAAEDRESQSQLAAFREGLQQLGWIDGRNLQIDTRWGAENTERTRRYAVELIALSPDLILAAGGPVIFAILRASRTVPIVFSQSIDPVGAGHVESLARPGGNVTGFMQFEYDLSGKWPELLKEMVPQVTRAAVLRNPTNAAGIGQWAVMQATARSFGLELSPINAHNAGDIERGIGAFARGGLNRGLIVPVSSTATVHRKLVIAQAALHRLPAVYPYRHFVVDGGLISYGPDLANQYRRAAGYVHRILMGENPADLPVQAPTKFNLTINLKTAKALGLTVPPTLLARADEVIE